MKAKKGFVLIETIVTTVILITTLVIIYSSFSSSLIKEQSKLYRDDIGYIYKATAMKLLIKNNFKSGITSIADNSSCDNECCFISAENTEIFKSIYSAYNPIVQQWNNLNIETIIYCPANTYNNDTSGIKAKVATYQNDDGYNDLLNYIKTINVSNTDQILFFWFKERKDGSKIYDYASDSSLDSSYETCVFNKRKTLYESEHGIFNETDDDEIKKVLDKEARTNNTYNFNLQCEIANNFVWVYYE